MSALIAFIMFALGGLACLCAGVWALLGTGWALIAGGLSLLAIAGFIRRGLIGD